MIAHAWFPIHRARAPIWAGVLLVAGCASPSPDPVAVSPASDSCPPEQARPAESTGDGPGAAGAGACGALWVVDAAGVDAGVLIRRGSDDNIAHRAIYDIVTVFHPPSGVFYELTMTDGVVRYPGTTFFQGSWCGQPVGVGIGGCTSCRAAWGTGFLHEDTWYGVVGGAEWEQAEAGSSRDAGVDAECTAHSTFNAKVYPIEPVAGLTPPVELAPPLHFQWR